MCQIFFAGEIYDLKLWPIVELMNSMLEKDVAKRCTAESILESEVFADSRESSATSTKSGKISRPDSGKQSGVPISRTSQPLEWYEETVKNLNTVKAKTFHWSSSRNEDSVGGPHETVDEILPEEIQKYEDAIDSDSESSSSEDSYSRSVKN